MKSSIVCLLVVVLFFGALAGCGSNPGDKEELVALKREHDTRLSGLCRRGDEFFEKSFHMSEKVPCGDAIVDVDKYLKCKEYTPIPGKETEFRKYLSEPKK